MIIGPSVFLSTMIVSLRRLEGSVYVFDLSLQVQLVTSRTLGACYMYYQCQL
jgi:hypothetical protein